MMIENGVDLLIYFIVCGSVGLALGLWLGHLAVRDTRVVRDPKPAKLPRAWIRRP
jgi:hypothetical protein